MPEVERWVIGKAILSMLSISRASISARPPLSTDLFMNELHASTRAGILVAKETKLTADLIREVQRILGFAKDTTEVSFEFEDSENLSPPLRDVRGLYVTADRIMLYEGSKLPKETKERDLLRLLPSANGAVRKKLQDVTSACLKQLQRTRKEFTQEDIWQRLSDEVKQALSSIGMRENVNYQIVPYHEDVGAVIALVLRDSSDAPASFVNVLRRIMLGKGPWEILVSDASADQELVLSIHDGGEQDFRH